MEINLTLILSTLFFTSILVNLPISTVSDGGDCPYPCYPPPTGTGTPIVTAPPSPPSQPTGSYSPPGYPTPTGNFPYYSPPPFGNSFNAPPPPDPNLPYFPFYYRKPPHQTETASATCSTPARSTLMMATSLVLTAFVTPSSFWLLI